MQLCASFECRDLGLKMQECGKNYKITSGSELKHNTIYVCTKVKNVCTREENSFNSERKPFNH